MELVVAERYVVFERIGKGSFGEVYRGTHSTDDTLLKLGRDKTNNKEVAIKFVSGFFTLFRKNEVRNEHN